MSILDKIIGRPLASWEGENESLSVWTGVPVLGLDALASTGYGPEAALTVLMPLSVPGLHYFPVIVIFIWLSSSRSTCHIGRPRPLIREAVARMLSPAIISANR